MGGVLQKITKKDQLPTLCKKTRTVLAVDEHAGRDRYRAAEKVFSPIHSMEDMTMPQKAV